MARTEAQKRADLKSRKKIYEVISFLSRKEWKINDLLKYAAIKKNISKTQYIVGSIKTQLSKDNITIDMLSETKIAPPEQPKQPKQYMVYLVTSTYVTAEEREEIEAGTMFVWEEYVSVFSTLAMAKKYIQDKFAKKPHPEDWYFTIYGRYFDAFTKLEATNKYREIVLEAVKKENDCWSDDSDDNDSVEVHYFLDTLKEYREPDYVEVVKYEQ